ncbi:MAG: LysR family transcriptional regulator [Pseudomonadota bacterium]
MVKRADFDFNLFRAMEVFVAVVETNQVTKAAALLGMTQSAASQNLRSLETALGTKLFDRTTRPVALTRAGITLQRHAARILNEIEQLTAEIQRLEALPLPVLRIGLLASIATTLTPELIQILRGRFKVPELTLHAGLASDHYELLANRRADIVVTSEPFYDSDGLERHTLLREPFFLVVPAGREAEAADFAAFYKSLPFARFTPQSPVGRKIDQHLRRVRLSFPRTIDADRASMVIAAVAGGHGFSIMTPTLLIDGLMEGWKLSVLPLPIAGFSRTITLIAREKELGTIPRVLAVELRQVLKATIADKVAPLLPGGLDPSHYGAAEGE